MASKSYGWDVRNIAKISPKMVKKRAIFRLQKKIPKPTPLPHMRLWFSVRSCAFNVVKCFFRIKDRNRAEEIERKGAIGQSMSPEWIVVILKNEKISLKAVEDTSEFFLNG